MPIDNYEENQELKKLRQTHPYYDLFEDKWRFFENSYVGGNSFVEGNIFRHSREHPDDWSDRIKRAANWNFAAITVDYYTNFIFSDVIERNGGSQDTFYREFIRNVNLKGDNVDSFMSQVSNDARIYGMVYVLVEAPPKPQEIETKQQEEDLGFRPYWVIIHPDEVLDWNLDKFDKYTYLKRRQYSTEIDPVSGERKEYEIYNEYFVNKIVRTKVDVTDKKKPIIFPKEDFINSLKEIPIVCLKYKKHKKFPDMGISFLEDIALINRSILNINSLILEFLYKQCFNVLIKQSSGFLNLQGPTDDLIGTNNVLEYPQGANAPAYLTPPVEPGKYLQSERSHNVAEIFRIAVQDVRSDLSNGEAASGFSQHQSFSRVVPFLSNWAERLEEAELKLTKLAFKYKGIKSFDVKVNYKDDYSITNVVDTMTNLLMLFKDLAIPSETFAKAQLKRLVAELDGKLPDEQTLRIMKEIDDMDFEEWGNQVRNQKGSPTEQQKDKQTGTIREVLQESVKSKISKTKKLKEK